MFVLLCCISNVGMAQPADQGLARALKSLPDDTAKVFKLSDLCFEYRRKDADTALWYGNQALALARKLRFSKGEAQALNDIAIIHLDRSDFPAADSALHRALAIRQRLGDDPGVGAIHNKLGNLYQAQLRLEEALEQNREALRIFERIGPPAKEAIILGNIAILDFNLRRYQEALAGHRAAADIRMSIGDSAGLAESRGNMANVWVALGDTAEALHAFTQAATYFKVHGLMREYAVQAHNEAGVRLARGESHQALTLYAEALALRERMEDRKAIASSLIGVADANLKLGNNEQARRSAVRALGMGRAVGANSEVMQAYKLLARIHAKLGNADSTLILHERYAALRDSVFSADMGGRMADLQARFGMERKERELEQQRADLGAKNLEIAELGRNAERRNFLLASVLGGSGVLVMAALLLFQLQKRRSRATKDAAVIAERESGLKALVENTDKERQRIAADLHDGVGQLLTGLKFRIDAAALNDPRWTDMRSLADEASREVRGIAHRMMPRALGESGLVPAISDMLSRILPPLGIAYELDHFGLEQRLPSQVETGAYRIAQELVNNIIKHAKAQRVNVHLLRNKGMLVMIVEDDGVGLDPTAIGNGLGMRTLNDRARILHGHLEVTSGAVAGTSAILRVPIPDTTDR